MDDSLLISIAVTCDQQRSAVVGPVCTLFCHFREGNSRPRWPH